MSEPGAQVDPEVDELPSFGCGYCPRDTVNKPRPLSYRGVPEQILSRTIEYKSLPQADHEEWRDRHRDVPCVFRNSLSYLFTVGQQVELHQLFYPPDPPLPVRSSPRVGRELPAGPRRKGWKADTESKLLSLCGYLRQSSTHRHEYESYPDWNEKLRQAQAVGLNLDPASRTYKVRLRTTAKPRVRLKVDFAGQSQLQLPTVHCCLACVPPLTLSRTRSFSVRRCPTN